MPLQTGQVLQRRYHIIRLLGQGGMGSVYLAKDSRLEERRCAIKEQVPDPNVTQKALTQLRQQFHIEARTLAKLDHPNLPKVSDYFSYAGNEYLVMDYIEGKDLESALQKFAGPLPEQPMLEWGIQVLNALDHLHRQEPPIIHRDIKPANIILTRQGEVKLVDFGLVKLLDGTNPRTVTIMRGMGTPEYTPLEQYASSSNHTDGRTDVYAFSATLYHLLTGIAPPDAPQRVIDSTLLISPRQHNPTLSQNTEAIILKGMSIAAKDRYQSAKLLRDALLKQLDVLNTGPTDPTKDIVRPRTALGTKRKSRNGSTIMRTVQLLSLLLIMFLLGTWAYNSFSDATVSEPAMSDSTVSTTTTTTQVTDSSVVIESQTPNSEDYPIAVKLADTPTTIPTQTARPISSNTIVVPSVPPASNTPLPLRASSTPPASSTPLPIRASSTPFLPTSTVNRAVSQAFPTAVSATTTIALDQTDQEAIALAKPSIVPIPSITITKEEESFTALAVESDTIVSPTLVPETTVPRILTPTATFPAAAKPVMSVPTVKLNADLVKLGITIAPTTILPGKSYWRVKEVTVEFLPDLSTIQVDTRNKNGERMAGQQVNFVWGSSSRPEVVESAGYSTYGVDFTMEATDQSYTVSVGDEPSEMVQGLRVEESISGEETANYSSYFIVFERVSE